MGFTYSSKLFGGIGSGGSGVGTSLTTQVLFNSSGAVAGGDGLTYDAATDTLTVVGKVNALGAYEVGSNSAFGSTVLNRATSGTHNTAGGFVALSVLSSGAENTAWGSYAGVANTTGNQNSYFGRNSGYTETGANGNISGSNNTWLGYASGPGTPTQLSNATAVGSKALNSASNQVVLGDASVTEVQLGTGGVAAGTASGYNVLGANGEQARRGYSSELITLSTVGATTDSSANLLPAGAYIEAVVARVTTTITTATDWQMGDATTPGRFTAANATLTAGTTDTGLVHIDQTGAAGPRQTAAAKVRITTTGTPGAGVVRVTVFWRQYVPGTT